MVRILADFDPIGFADKSTILAVCLIVAGTLTVPPQGRAAELSDTVAMVKPSIVGVGTYQATRRPPAKLLGTGFAVNDGRFVATAAHVIEPELDEAKREYLAIFVGTGRSPSVRRATIVARDDDHDVALLSYDGPRLPGLRIGEDKHVREGQSIAFTGYPIGAVLGLFPVTHRGIVSALTPIAVPSRSSRELDTAIIRRLSDNFPVFQLDATAYPGNSGSPVYEPGTGRVLGVISSVYVKESKERILQEPSGITYAIPVRHVQTLIAIAKE